jgi:FKBP-type peptidyl-prolyl cis-trans isomerases 1
MNKKLYVLIALLSALCFFNSCVGDDEESGIDEVWKAYNEQIVRDVAANSEYELILSFTGDGSIYWKASDVITSTMKSSKITEDGTPYITDSVVCRYTGWYLDYDGKKVEFDSTENNEQAGRGFNLGIGLLSGWNDMLLHMRQGDEVEFCIPYRLGYGVYGKGSIPAYTTLWFNMKLLKIIPRNPGEFD